MATQQIKNIASYRVIYGDTDQMGVAYYANYLRWFEIGRTEFLRQVAVPYTSIEEKGLCFPVAEVSCRYHKPAHYDDAITIETSLTALSRASLTFSYRLFRPGRDLIASGWTRHACVDREGRVTRIPADLEAILMAQISSYNSTSG
ncbi:MAG: acyl-CoA thioesterase [Deltaproteobacteria bacterium]|nr:acyl-CoA thioesterase [Deltaproteobacteria bacterium]